MLFDQHFVRAGRFVSDGVELAELLAVRGTPCYLYSAGLLLAKLGRLQTTFPGFDILYSAKANPNIEIIRLLGAAGAGAEISSRGELLATLAAGIAPANIVYVGPVKSRADINLAVSHGIFAIVVDSAPELAEVDSVAVEQGRDIRVLLRINTHEPAPEAKEVMVGGPSKFGFDEELVVEQVRSVPLRRARISGIQVYSASSVLDSRWLGQHIDYVAALAQRLAAAVGFKLDCIDFGGGFGVPMNDEQPELVLGPVAAAAARARAKLGRCRLLFESGRYIVAEAGLFITRIVRVKESRGRILAICDGGMNAFSRPVFMRISHPVRLLNRLTEPPTTTVDICGPICTPLDCAASTVRLPRPQPDDIVGFGNAGAYGYTMSLLEFMSLGRPAELLTDAGTLRVIREPQPSSSEQAAAEG